MCATEVAAQNILLLSTLGQENNIGTTGLQCKPLPIETPMHCRFCFLYMSFRAVGVSRIRAANSREISLTGNKNRSAQNPIGFEPTLHLFYPIEKAHLSRKGQVCFLMNQILLLIKRCDYSCYVTLEYCGVSDINAAVIICVGVAVSGTLKIFKFHQETLNG